MVLWSHTRDRTIASVAFGFVLLGASGCAAHLDGEGPVEPAIEDARPRTLTLRRSVDTTLGEGAGVLRGERKCRARANAGERSAATCLIRFPMTEIPRGSQVTRVLLHFEVLRGSPAPADVHAVTSSWSARSATWTKRNGSNAWQSPGGQGASDRSSPFQAFIFSETGAFEGTLNDAGISLVQSWVDDPSRNFGLMITSSDSSVAGLAIASSQHRVAEERPAITVTFVAPD
jgi:hypothetical protein